MSRRLQVVALRNQGAMTDQIAKILEQDAITSAHVATEEAKNRAQIDYEQDQQEEERALVKYDQMDLDLVNADAAAEDSAGKAAAGEEAVSGLSADNFNSKVREASSEALLLSWSVVKQTFGTLEMGDENEYNQGVAGGVEADVHQQFGNTKIGSKNKVSQGVFR